MDGTNLTKMGQTTMQEGWYRLGSWQWVELKEREHLLAESKLKIVDPIFTMIGNTMPQKQYYMKSSYLLLFTCFNGLSAKWNANI